MAAKRGEVAVRSTSTSLGPAGGPITRAKAPSTRTGRASFPASAEPSQSTISSLVNSTTGRGTSS
jgi:hypothetical protein